jgi:hypothetical protein
MLAAEADILKMVTWAATPADNLRLLSLIPRARQRSGDHRFLHGAIWASGPGWRRRFWGAF